MYRNHISNPLYTSWNGLLKAVPNKALLFTLSGWIAYMIYGTLHCSLYTNYVNGNRYTLLESFQWNMQQYLLWPPLTYLLFRTLSALNWRDFPRSISMAFALCLGCLLLTTTYRVGFDLWEKSDTNVMSSLVYFGYQQVNTLSFIVLFWALSYRLGFFDDQTLTDARFLKRKGEEQKKNENDASDKTSQPLAVYRGQQEIQISISQIEIICAAGNYMEITCGEDSYLLRSTLKELEQQLPPSQFIRIHRSYIINRDSILTLNDHNHITMKNGTELPIGQRYKQNIEH